VIVVSEVLVLNASYEVLTSVTWQRAVTMVVTGEAVVHEADPQHAVHSQHLTVPLPRTVRLVRYVHVRFRRGGHVASKRGVLVRDRRTCIYCGRTGLTVDHLVPQSRGGRHTWENLAACCGPCNNKKADRTPEEAGMRLRWTPWRPDSTAVAQRQVWRSLV
jgi:5-methylcytosine-specific restriction endonuclease McrA